jgi:RHH-type transcriptional regulator, proline utilization regulon repressor / proline dehydrogenase / delta 1-pyrroline-5-carboxylate dehydrogenase
MSSRIVHPGETPEGIVSGLVKRLGQPAVRTATRQAMRVLGHHFVLGETIERGAATRARREGRGFRHSYDMLGEGARTAADAERYFAAYADAIEAIGKRPAMRRAAGAARHFGQALGAASALRGGQARARDARTGAARARTGARAKRHDLNFTVDAEEADRLEISLDVIAAVPPILRSPAGTASASRSRPTRSARRR